MTTIAATSFMTAEEFYEFCRRPENSDRFLELDRGEVVEMNQPGIRHGVVCANVVRLLGNYVVSRNRGYVVSNDAGLIVERDPDSVYGPDACLFDETRSFDELEVQYEERPPALIVEVLSPSDRPGRVTKRLSRYQAQGVPLIWGVDPETRSVAVYRIDDAMTVLEEDAILTGGNVLPDLAIPVGDLFSVPGLTE